MTTYSWKAVDTYEGSNLQPTVMQFSADGNVIVTANATTTLFFEIVYDNITPQGFVVEQNNISDDRVWNIAVSDDGTSIAKTLENRVVTYKNTGFNTWQSTLVYHAPHNDFYGAGLSYNTGAANGSSWLAGGAPNGFLDSNDEDPKGYVNVFDYTTGSNIGGDIIGEDFNDRIGYIIYLRNNRLALMAATGLLYLYNYDGNNWNKLNSTDIGIGNHGILIFDPNSDTVRASQRVYQYTADSLFDNFGYIFDFATASGTALFVYNVTANSQVRLDAESPQTLACIQFNAAGNSLLVSYVNSNLFRVYQFVNSAWKLTNTVTTSRIINVTRFNAGGTRVMVSGTDTVTGKDYLTYYQYTLDPPPEPPVAPPVTPPVVPPAPPVTPPVVPPAQPAQPASGTPTSKSSTAKSTSLPVIIGIGSIIGILAVIAVIVLLIHLSKRKYEFTRLNH